MGERMTIEAIREKYPAPKRNTDPSVGAIDCYCIAGALCVEVDPSAKLFPEPMELKVAIQKATNGEVYPPAMRDKEYERFCRTCERVVALNDIGKFEAAWRQLARLLNWKTTDFEMNRR